MGMSDANPGTHTLHKDMYMFNVGDRVETQAFTDSWMQGDRYGNVVMVGKKWIHVIMDRSNRVRKYTKNQLKPVT